MSERVRVSGSTGLGTGRSRCSRPHAPAHAPSACCMQSSPGPHPLRSLNLVCSEHAACASDGAQARRHHPAAAAARADSTAVRVFRAAGTPSAYAGPDPDDASQPGGADAISSNHRRARGSVACTRCAHPREASGRCARAPQGAGAAVAALRWQTRDELLEQRRRRGGRPASTCAAAARFHAKLVAVLTTAGAARAASLGSQPHARPRERPAAGPAAVRASRLPECAGP